MLIGLFSASTALHLKALAWKTAQGMTLMQK